MRCTTPATLLSAACLAVIFVPLAVPTVAAELSEQERGDGFVCLFDGQGLSGWTMGPDKSWVVEDGVIAEIAAPGSLSAGDGVESVEIARRARHGETAAQASLARHVDRMARALAGVINIVDPDVIVLGGGVSNIASLYDDIPSRWGRYVFSDRVDTRLVQARHGDSSGVRGAAWLWPPG